VAEMDPMVWLFTALTRADLEGNGGWNLEETIDLATAVLRDVAKPSARHITRPRRGSLTPGKDADVVVLSRDLFADQIRRRSSGRGSRTRWWRRVVTAPMTSAARDVGGSRPCGRPDSPRSPGRAPAVFMTNGPYHATCSRIGSPPSSSTSIPVPCRASCARSAQLSASPGPKPRSALHGSGAPPHRPTRPDTT
jgi:hypothetical protein